MFHFVTCHQAEYRNVNKACTISYNDLHYKLQWFALQATMICTTSYNDLHYKLQWFALQATMICTISYNDLHYKLQWFALQATMICTTSYNDYAEQSNSAIMEKILHSQLATIGSRRVVQTLSPLKFLGILNMWRPFLHSRISHPPSLFRVKCNVGQLLIYLSALVWHTFCVLNLSNLALSPM